VANLPEPGPSDTGRTSDDWLADLRGEH
jgi:hypothetical protein